MAATARKSEIDIKTDRPVETADAPLGPTDGSPALALQSRLFEAYSRPDRQIGQDAGVARELLIAFCGAAIVGVFLPYVVA
ncbi:MAG: hypothetical protein AAFX03_13225 [Pseudomonadota bacterium]